MADPTPSRIDHQRHVDIDGYAEYNVRTIYFDDGSLWIEVCPTCHYVRAKCNHSKNSWTEDGSTLLCNFCGLDGT